MKAERLILSLIAILIGLFVAGGAFYFYQSSKALSPQKTKNLSLKHPTPTPDTGNFLAIDSPKDNEVFSKKIITVSGKTLPKATIVISSESDDQIITPGASGNFSTTQTIGDDSNLLTITAIFPNGEEKNVQKIVSFSTEEF